MQKKIKTQALFVALTTFQQLFSLISGFNMLVSFLEATFWHFSEPDTLGVIAWPIVCLAVAFLSPGAVVAVIDKFKIPEPSYFVTTFLPVIGPFLLFVASLIESHAASRTIILTIGVFLFQINFKCSCLNSLQGIDSVFVISVFLTMVARQTSNSVNLFYENWKVSLVIFVFSFVIFSVQCLDVSTDFKLSQFFQHKQVSTVNSSNTSNSGDLDLKETSGKLAGKELSYKKPSKCILLLQNFLLIPGITASVMVFVQFFTSPHQFIKWSGYSAAEQPLQYVITILFFLTTLALCILENSNWLISSELQNESKESSYIKVSSFLFLISLNTKFRKSVI